MNARREAGQPYERLRRLLFVVPFVSKNPGLSVDEVAAELGIGRSELLEELDLLTLVGRPPFQPDDFVDIYVEDDRVFVDLDQRLKAPPRITAAEGVALGAAAALLRPASGDTLRTALEKLERVLPAHAVQRFRDMGRQLDLALEGPPFLGDLSRAILEHREVELEYFTASRGQTETRRVRPLLLTSSRGQWYLTAHCLSRGGERLFRLDRIAHLTITEASFVPRVGEPERRPPDEAEEQVRVRFPPDMAPYIKERFGAVAQEVSGGAVEVLVPGDSERWLTQWILAFGGDAVVLEPPWAVQAVAHAAQAALDSQ